MGHWTRMFNAGEDEFAPDRSNNAPLTAQTVGRSREGSPFTTAWRDADRLHSRDAVKRVDNIEFRG